MTASVLDLLRERRQELGHPSMSGLLVSRPGLLRQGLVVGSALVGVTLGAILLVFLIHEGVKRRMAELQSIEVQANVLKAQVASREQQLKQISDTNTNLAKAITNTATSSGLLTSLQLLAPEGVQLESVDVQGNALVLKGKAEDPKAFSRINALQLSLAGSPLLSADSLQVRKVERPNSARQEGNQTRAARFVTFELGGSIAELPPMQQLGLLRQLNAEGMALRLQRLQAEGLL